MSLKRQVEDPRSPLRGFFVERLGDAAGLRRLRERWAGQLGNAMLVPPPHEPTGRYRPDEVGHAFGVRAGLMFAPTLPTALVPPPLHPVSGRSWSSAALVWELAEAEIARVRPHLAWPSGRDEEFLCRLCHALGGFDQLFRTGPWPGMPILELEPDAPASAALDLWGDTCISDTVSLVAAAREALAAISREDVVVGPSFVGSPDVGGADADVLVGPTLVEIKTTVRPTLELRTVHQLIGYALLDYEDRHRIDEVAVYMARYGRLVVMPLAEVLWLLAGRRVDVKELRAALRASLGSAISLNLPAGRTFR